MLFSSSTLIYGSYFFPVKPKKVRTTLDRNTLSQVNSLCGAVLNLEITAIVQNPLCLSFHQKQKKKKPREGIKKGLKNGLDTTVIPQDCSTKARKQEPSWRRPWQRVA
jgi:hypothetical protein